MEPYPFLIVGLDTDHLPIKGHTNRQPVCQDRRGWDLRLLCIGMRLSYWYQTNYGKTREFIEIPP